MSNKIVLLKDLNFISDFPVVDILTSEGYRLGCATTCLVNWIMKLDLFEPEKFSNTAEMALFFEGELHTKSNGEVKIDDFYKILDCHLKENENNIENYSFKAEKITLEFVLFFLLNDFTGLVVSQTSNDEGHGDIFYKEMGKVFYNCLEISLWDLARILYSSEGNLVVFGRSLKRNKRLLLKSSEMGVFKKTLSQDEKYMLAEREIFFIENSIEEIVKKYPSFSLFELLREKELTLKGTGYLDNDLIILYKGNGTL